MYTSDVPMFPTTAMYVTAFTECSMAVYGAREHGPLHGHVQSCIHCSLAAWFIQWAYTDRVQGRHCRYMAVYAGVRGQTVNIGVRCVCAD
jgi:hypothetical protein